MPRVTNFLATHLSPNGQDGESGMPIFPLSFLGMGFLIAWLCCTHLPHCFVFADLSPQGDILVDYSMRVGDIGTFLVAVIVGRSFEPWGRHRRICATIIVLGALGTLMAPPLVMGQAPRALVALVSMVAGCSGAMLFLLWANIYSRLGASRCVLYGGGSCILAGCTALVIANLNYEASTVAIALLPLMGGALATISFSRLPEPLSMATTSQNSAIRYPIPWKLVLLMALAGFASGFAGSLLVEQDGIGAIHRIVATTLFGALLLVLFIVRQGAADIRVLAHVTLPLAIASLVLIPTAGQSLGTAVSFLVKLSYVSFALFVLLMLAQVAYRRGIPSTRVFASARAASELAMLLGILLRRWMRATGILDNQTMLWVITLVGLVVVTGCVLLWHSERTVSTNWGTDGVDPASGLRIVSEREHLLERCATIAKQHHLTAREEEILSLLASGVTPSSIEQTLFLSHNTLKTHMRHIYAKLDVHTRSEAVALVKPPLENRPVASSQ